MTLLMAYYQIVRGQDLAAQAVAMRSQQIELKEYHRGVIWDRNLLPLTGTRTTSALYCFPQEAFQSEGSPGKKATISDTAINDLAQRLVDIVPGLTSNQVVKDIKRSLQAGEPFIRLATDLTDSQVALLQRQDQPGVIVAPVQKRYVTTGFLAHIIGTVEKGKTVRGLSGIEKVYDDVLSTNPASLEMVSVQDARGEVINGLMYKIRQEQDQARGSVVLTIDKRVQTALETLMDERVPKGAVVVMDIETRQILEQYLQVYNMIQSYLEMLTNIKVDLERLLAPRNISRFWKNHRVRIERIYLEKGHPFPADYGHLLEEHKVDIRPGDHEYPMVLYEEGDLFIIRVDNHTEYEVPPLIIGRSD